MTISEKFGKALKDRRQAQGKSQLQFSIEAKMSSHYLSEIENGKRNPSLDTIENLCATLSVPMSELFKDIEKLK